MKTSKEKTISKPKKTIEARKATENKKVTTSKSGPSEDAIREKAKEVYQNRIDNEVYGTAENDWIKAEKLLRSTTK